MTGRADRIRADRIAARITVPRRVEDDLWRELRRAAGFGRGLKVRRKRAPALLGSAPRLHFMATLRGMVRALLAFLPCVLAAYSLAAVFASEVMLRGIDAAGFPVTLHNRIQVVLHDLPGLAPLYLPRIAVALAPAMLLATLLALLPGVREPRWLRASVYVACGATAVVVMHLLIRAYDPVHALGITGASGGLLLQGVAGGFGAYVYFVATGQAHR